MQVVISPSNKPTKKFEARLDGKKSIQFGSKGMSDFTIHEDPERKHRYLQRHTGMGEDWSNPLTAGSYATNILWNKPTIAEGIRNTNRGFPNLHVIHKS